MYNSEILISIVVPVKNEEESIAGLAREITEAMATTSYSWECVWVDDGSTDGTLDVLQGINATDGRHHWMQLDRNYGQSAALAAGFSRVRGPLVATLDGDGQNDPKDLPELIHRLQAKGVDMVNGVRTKRRDSIIRKTSSKIANRFRNWLTSERVTDVGCSIRVFRRECLEGVPVFRGMHRFFPTLVRMNGFKIDEVAVNHRQRAKGATNYGIHDRLWVGIVDTLAVCWMQNRFVRPAIKKTSSPLVSPEDRADR